MTVTLAAASENFGRDLEENYSTIARLVAEATAAGADLLALPEAAIGGYLSSLGGARRPVQAGLPAAGDPDRRSRAGPRPRARRRPGLVLGICEADGPEADRSATTPPSR